MWLRVKLGRLSVRCKESTSTFVKWRLTYLMPGYDRAVTGLAMRLKRERQGTGGDGAASLFKSSAFISSLIESTRPPSAEYAEMYVAAVRSWLRSEWWAPQRRRLA